jgi:hypothetical protein
VLTTLLAIAAVLAFLGWMWAAGAFEDEDEGDRP